MEQTLNKTCIFLNLNWLVVTLQFFQAEPAFRYARSLLNAVSAPKALKCSYLQLRKYNLCFGSG